MERWRRKDLASGHPLRRSSVAFASPCSLRRHSMFISLSCRPHSAFMPFTVRVQSIFMPCSFRFHAICCPCSFHAPSAFMRCSFHVHFMLHLCSQSIFLWTIPCYTRRLPAAPRVCIIGHPHPFIFKTSLIRPTASPISKNNQKQEEKYDLGIQFPRKH